MITLKHVLCQLSMPTFESQTQCQWLLNANRIDIWYFSTQLQHDWWPILSTHEQSRAKRFYFKHHQERFIQSHGAMRYILAQYTKLAPNALNFNTDKHGKPYLLNSEISFNLSHSEEYALLAIGKKQALGIDVEAFKPRPLTGIANHMFSKQECDQLKAAPQCTKSATFFSIWSQKEALIKACGLGLHYPTKQFNCEALKTKPYSIRDDLHKKDWTMLSFFLKPGYAAAVCYETPKTDLNFYQFPSTDSLPL